MSSMAEFPPNRDITDMEDDFFHIEISTEHDASLNVLNGSNRTNLTATHSDTDSSMLCKEGNDEFNLTSPAKVNSSELNLNDPPITHQNTSTSGILLALSSPHKLPGKITKVLTDKAFTNLKNFKKDSALEVTPKICKTIKECLKDFPNLDSYQDIASRCKVDQNLVLKYLDKNLTMDDIIVIKQNSKHSVEELSNKLGKNESVITEYIHQYTVHHVEHKYHTELQEKRIKDISKAFENSSFSPTDYKTIVTHSFDPLINEIKNGEKSKKFQNLIEKLLPLIFYYIRCSLPFEDIIQIITNVSGISLTSHDLFHGIFQLSDPVLQGICIEDYSFSNPVPLYYPRLKPPQSKFKGVEFEICKELWYCLEQYNGLISFGLGRASWNTVGKSTLLDLIFETDFEKGNPQNSAFHFRSIDIQLTKNLFGESNSESTKWAYIDCHSCSDLSVIQALCSHLDVALIHVCYNDYKNNKAVLDCQLTMLKLKHVYIFLRDCDCDVDTIEITRLYDADMTYIFIPDLTRMEIPFINSLKKIGYEIMHLNIKEPQFIQSQFIYETIQHLKDPAAEDIQMDCELIENITQPLCNSNKTNSSLFNFYPIFVEYMSAYHQASHELDQDAVDALNSTCKKLDKKLKDTRIGDFVMFFNYILSRPNSILILRKLSRELSRIHPSELETAVVPGKEEKNNEYTLWMLWREILLSYKYGRNNPVNSNFYDEVFASNYSQHVESGEAFELIDGDNLRFFNKEINVLLTQHYEKQTELLDQINRDKTVKIKPAPIVVSILGPQSSGKSTLLNYCFGCKFLTSAGRCTRGIYASLSKLDRPVNLSQSFLILDTEGLDAIERENIKDTSMIHFDRTMVLFCLSVSQVVIINIKGDIGSEMQNLLQICAYSLDRLKVSKVKAPKIFFVLNQQADPDPNKHLDAINLLMEKLNSEFGLMENGVKISDLIQVSRENLFILPSAFNSQQMNKPDAKLFDSNVIKLSPTIAFADKCTNLRLAIIDKLDHMPVDDRAPFQSMSEWLEMAGVIWDTIIKYQDIVKCRETYLELKRKEIGKLDKTVIYFIHIFLHNSRKKFKLFTSELCLEIYSMTLNLKPDIILSKQMSKFDEVFDKHKCLCLAEFSCNDHGQHDYISEITERMPNRPALYLLESIDFIRKEYEDLIKRHIKSCLNLHKEMKEFQKSISENAERYLNCNIKDFKDAFSEIWRKSFGNEDEKDINKEDELHLSSLYPLFELNFTAMEEKEVIFRLFNTHEFRMDGIIYSIKRDILSRFGSPSQSLHFIDTLEGHHVPINDMVPYKGESNYSYLCPSSLYITTKGRYSSKTSIVPREFIPPTCHGLLQSCSGYYNQEEIIWNPKKNTQINILISSLVDSTFAKFINDISSDTLEILKSPHTFLAQKITDMLCFRIRLFNYEIGFVHARLSRAAARALSTLVFAHAFKHHCENNSQISYDIRKKMDQKKSEIFETFSKNLGNINREKWNRDWLAKRDKEKSQKFALEYIDLVKKELRSFVNQKMETLFEDRRESLSHESLLSLAHELFLKELAKEPSKEVTDVDNFVVQFICNRNIVLEKLYQEKFDELELLIHTSIKESLKTFHKENFNIKGVLNILFSELQKIAFSKGSIEGFDSDNNFALFERDKLNPNDSAVKKLPFRAMVQFLEMYLDPKLPQGKFMKQIFSGFEIDGLKVVVSDNYALCSKPIEPILDEDTFQKLVNTGMFNSTELIFNIYEYVKQFQEVINGFEIELRQNEFHEMAASLRNEFQKKIFGCPSQCPSCGKFCEREVHTNEGKCQIKTGHQISSMGGKVWNADKDNTAVLFMCDDYKNYTHVTSPCGEMEWGWFKDKCGSEWNWNLPTDEMNTSKQLSNQKIMKDVWNKFGRGILNYYETQGTRISYVPYTDSEEVEMKKRLGQANQSGGRGSVSSGEIFIDYKD